VAVATRQAVGAGQVIYVAFTFEDIATGADAAFAQLLPSTGLAGAAPATAGFAPRRARTSELTVTGTGRLSDGPPFVARRARTSELTVTGTGRLSDGPPFQPRRAQSAELSVTGTGSLK
jgi:hypothetical protein